MVISWWLYAIRDFLWNIQDENDEDNEGIHKKLVHVVEKDLLKKIKKARVTESKKQKLSQRKHYGKAKRVQIENPNDDSQEDDKKGE